MTRGEKETVSRIREELARMDAELRCVWAQIDWRLGILDGGSGVRQMKEVLATGRARDLLRQACKVLDGINH